jgi:hypothetical protein
LYLNNTVYVAKTKFKHQSLALFSEVPFEHLPLPGVGYIGGNLNYLTSTVRGNVDVRERGDECRISTPYLLVNIEAKSDTTIGLEGSIAQLYAQLLTLESSDSCEGSLPQKLIVLGPKKGERVS